MNKSKGILKYILLLFMLCMFLMQFVVLHEEVHRAIMNHHNCIDVDVTYGLPVSSTICNEYSSRTELMILQESNLHMWNEIVGYNFQIFIAAMFACILFAMILKDLD